MDISATKMRGYILSWLKHPRNLYTYAYVEYIELMWTAATVQPVKDLQDSQAELPSAKVTTELEIVILFATYEQNSLAPLFAIHSITHFGIIYLSAELAVQ